MSLQFFNIVNGQKRCSSQSHQGTNPRTEQPLWDVPIATPQDLDDAVAAAGEALKSWRDTTVAERQALLVKMCERIQEHKQQLMDILMQETGKSSLLAEIEITNTCFQTTYYSTNALQDEIVHEDASLRIVATHTPLGLIGAICPWNFPLILSNIKIVSSLVTGNCVLIKPSPFTPYSVLKSVELTHDVFPPGVIQVLNGDHVLGRDMTLHPGIAKISFTGTTETGKKVMEACSRTLKRVTLELAGNDAGIVCEDVDIKKVAGQVAAGAFFNGGQMCVCTKRVYVHENIYDEFLREFKAAVETGFAINRDIAAPSPFGPVSNKMQYDIVKGIVEDCKKNGYEIVSGGNVSEEGGYWIPPTIVSKPPEDSMIVKEEQFGPIVPLLSWSDEEEVIARANLGNAGLGASVYSSDVSRAERIARRMEAGTVWINMPEMPHPAGYFSGQKDSGHGGEMGKQGLLSYCYTQSLQFAK